MVGFSDASKTGNAACICVQTEYTKNPESSEILVLVDQSIRQIELVDTLILTRIMNKIIGVLQHAIPIEWVFYVTASDISLTWIKNNNDRYKQFIKNQVRKKRANSDVKKLNQISGKENIADLESRRMYFEDFKIDQVRD